MAGIRFMLLNLITYGVKNLQKPIEIRFANKSLGENAYEKPLLKAIYGTNGEGKTAIAHTLEIYKNSCVDENYLPGESYNGSFLEIVNSNLKEVSIDLCFALVSEEGKPSVFRHALKYRLEGKTLTVVHEILSSCKANGFGREDGESVIYEVEEGRFTSLRFPESDKAEILDATRNLLGKSSALIHLLRYIFKKTGSEAKLIESQRAYKAPLCAMMFALNLHVYIDKKDEHKVSMDSVRSLMDSLSRSASIPMRSLAYDAEADIIGEKSLEDYISETKKIASFLKVFKPGLKEIEVKADPMGEGRLLCKKILVYEDGTKVNSEYESSGVKKLIRLYPVLNVIEEGGVAFIDEFDSNIHDVYLCKLVEYFLDFSNGQLIFTTHNLGPMEVLDASGAKHAIDFINRGEISSWTRNGNYSVVNLYRSGAIKNCPFNIDAADFAEAFGK